MFKKKTKGVSSVYKCPHCSKEVEFTFDVETTHDFKHEVVSDNKIIKAKIQKHG